MVPAKGKQQTLTKDQTVAIDILFIIMVTFGFYFGFTFGMMKVALMVLSLFFAVVAAMAFTPMTTNLIVDTFNVDSVFLPFFAFLITLLVVLMLARILTKLVEETVDNKRFDTISQVLGGLVMAVIFTLLYSVLVTFFGQAGVVKLVLNREVFVTQKDQDIHLLMRARSIDPDTLVMVLENEPQPIRFTTNKEETAFKLSFGSEIREKKRQAYISGPIKGWEVLRGDTVSIRSEYQKEVYANDKMLCFCNTEFLIEAQGDTIYFQCQDRLPEAKSMTSFFYKYIEIIPRRGTQVLEGMAPFVDQFIEYMSIALERLDKGDRRPKRPINVYSEEDNKTTVHPIEEEDPINLNSDSTIQLSIDTSNLPSVSPKKDNIAAPKDSIKNNKPAPDEPEEKVEYEG